MSFETEGNLMLLFTAISLLAVGTWQSTFPEQAIKWNQRTLPRKLIKPLDWLLTPAVYRFIGRIAVVAGIALLLYCVYLFRHPEYGSP
jgi:hypothetical protein